VSGRNPEAESINEQIGSFTRTIYRHYSLLVKKGEIPSVNKLKDLFYGVEKEGKTLVQVFEYHNSKMKKLIGSTYSKGTYTRYEICLRLLIEFMESHYKCSDFPINQIKLEFITGFDYFLRTVRKCNNNTTLKYIKNLRKIINEARAFEWMTHDPFLNYKGKLENVDRVVLTQLEIDTISSKQFGISRLNSVKDVFLFSCYTGLAYSDVKKLTKDNLFVGIEGQNWIQVNRTKTNVMSKIPVLPLAQDILDRYKDHPFCKKEGKLLPVLSNQKYNSYLKEIADCCGINKTLTTHIARHTFATTITLNNNISIETVSKMLGHRSIKTTEQYAKVLDVKIFEDMSKLVKKYKTVNLLKAINE
jgi:site-specific recombinase XerD